MRVPIWLGYHQKSINQVQISIAGKNIIAHQISHFYSHKTTLPATQLKAVHQNQQEINLNKLSVVVVIGFNVKTVVNIGYGEQIERMPYLLGSTINSLYIQNNK